MRRIARHALTYFATAGIILLLIAGILLLSLIDKYNETRRLDLVHTIATTTSLALGQTLLIAGVTTYIATRRGYTPPPLPAIPRVKTVALIPAYNEEGRVGHVVEKAKKYVDLVIVVDDGSKDKTAEEAEKAGALVIRHPQNMGYGAAVKTLMRAALASGAQYAVLLDADGQHNPDDIPKFIKALEDGAEMAVGNRFRLSKVPTYRKLGIYAIRLALRLFGVRTGDPENGYRAFTNKALTELEPALQEIWMGISSQTVYLAHKKKLRIREVDTAVTYGTGTSTENPISHGLSIIWTLAWTWLTENPVRTLGLGVASLAFSAVLLSIAMALFNVTRYIRLTYTTAGILLEVIGTILLAIGITAASIKR